MSVVVWVPLQRLPSVYVAYISVRLSVRRSLSLDAFFALRVPLNICTVRLFVRWAWHCCRICDKWCFTSRSSPRTSVFCCACRRRRRRRRCSTAALMASAGLLWSCACRLRADIRWQMYGTCWTLQCGVCANGIVPDVSHSVVMRDRTNAPPSEHMSVDLPVCLGHRDPAHLVHPLIQEEAKPLISRLSSANCELKITSLVGVVLYATVDETIQSTCADTTSLA